MSSPVPQRENIRDFLVTRRARLTPEQVGLPPGVRRRVVGLRREEVAVLSGVSTEWYTRLEKGHIAGVSEDVLSAVGRALRLTDDERSYLFDLAKGARPRRRTAARPEGAAVEEPVQWFVDSITGSAVLVRDGRLDVMASNALGRALHSPMFDSPTSEGARPNLARFYFLDPASREFFVDWDGGAAATVALLRAAAGREPGDRALHDLVRELSTASPDFRTVWASHDVRTRHVGMKRLHHPVVGHLELAYQAVEIFTPDRPAHGLNTYTAEPGTTHADRLRLLAGSEATAPVS